MPRPRSNRDWHPGSGAMSPLDPFDLPPEHKVAVERIMSLIVGGEEMTNTYLREGPGSDVGIEKFAREYVEANPASDLGILYSILSVTTCVAAQGGFVLQVPISGGGWLKVPAIQMALGVAPSGWRKSTALDVGMEPLRRALREGVAYRKKRSRELLDAAMAWVEQNDVTLAIDPKQFREVFDGGICAKTLSQDPTQEALRNQAVKNGGHVGIMAGEADIFRNLTLYSPDGASLTFFLNLWDQREIDSARVSNEELFIDDASLCLMVLFQTQVFAEVTSGGSRGMATGADSFMDRGMFGRMWVVETSKTSSHVATAQAYSDDVVFDHNRLNGYANSDGELTALGAAATDFETALHTLVEETSDYRMDKALHRAWQIASIKHGTEMQVPEQPAAERISLWLDPEAEMAYKRVQRMQAALESFLDQPNMEDNQALWEPLVSRFTQHVLREALTMSLAANRRTAKGERYIPAEFIEDAAIRLIPWRWCLSACALTRRTYERVEDVIAASLTVNPKQVDLTIDAKVESVLEKLTMEDPRTAAAGFDRARILSSLRSTVPRSRRRDLAGVLYKVLDRMVLDPDSKVSLTHNSTEDRPLYRVVSPAEAMI